MRRISDTELVRNYCEKNIGDILDINYASENIFVDIPHVNLRKIVSRLIDSGILRTISKGVYAIGESPLSDEERVINHYTKAASGLGVGLPVGDYLLYKKGYISNEPKEKIIKSNISKGNKKIGNVQIIESHSCFEPIGSGYDFVVAMELMTASKNIEEDKIKKYENEINALLRNYSDMNFKAGVKDLYPGNVYYLLEHLLNVMQISNDVRGVYAIQVRLHSKE